MAIVYGVMGLIGAVVYVLTLPYAVYYNASNFEMSENDHRHVEVYLAYFERLHPDLMAHVSAASARALQPERLNMWPRKIDTEFGSGVWLFPIIIAGKVRTTVTRLDSAWLFACLETAGWDRKVLWAFLRDQVEASMPVTQEEKTAFAAAMERITAHQIYGKIWKTLEDALMAPLEMGKTPALKDDVAQRLENLSMPIHHVDGGSLQWLLHRRAVLLPSRRTQRLMKPLADFPLLWGPLNEGDDIEKGPDGSWQLIRL